MTEGESDLPDSSARRAARSRHSCQPRCGPELAGLRVRIAPED